MFHFPFKRLCIEKLSTLGIVLSLSSISPFVVYGNGIVFSGNTKSVLEFDADATSGLNRIYVLATTNNVRISYLPDNPERFTWSKYGTLGGGYSEIANCHKEGEQYVLDEIPGDLGYIIEDGNRRFTFWIVDYSDKVYDISEMTFPFNQDCQSMNLDISGNASSIHYTAINGRQFTLSRNIEIIYNTLEWDQKSKQFIQREKNENKAYIDKSVTISPPPYCSTSFTIKGDRFLKAWGEEREIESAVTASHAVTAETEAIQRNHGDEESSNRIPANTAGELGGSAPAEISFIAYTTDAVIHNEWQISKDPEFNTIDYRFNEQDIDFTFNEEGTFYVRFIGSNSDGSCETVSETYTVGIGSSELKCPNAFSPNDDGVNDIWKVSYRSLIEFKCWIFDRNGREMCHFNSPEDGWDGKHNGKAVKPGVYYYVIQAKGADGKNYKKSGDINIINYKQYSNKVIE